MQSLPDMHLGKCLYILQDAFHKEIRNLEQLGILEETKDVTEWGEQLCDHGEEGLQPTPARFQPTPAIKDTLWPRN